MDNVRSLRQRPLLEVYSASEAWNAAEGIKETLMKIQGENTRYRFRINELEKENEKLRDAIKEMRHEEE